MKKMKMFKRVASLLLAFALTATSVSLDGLTVQAAEEKAAKTNFALQGTATANDQETDYYGPDKAIDGIVNREETNKPNQSRWATNTGTSEKVLTVDLGEAKTFDEFKIAWERTNIKGFKISVSNDNQNYKDVYTKSDDSYVSEDTAVTLASAETAQYVKLTINSYDGGDLNWPSVSLYEFEILGAESGEVVPPETDAQDPQENVARGKTAVADSTEAPTLGADKAVDGDKKSGSSRWASAVNHDPHWIYVDLGEEMNVQTVKIFWEMRKATNYAVQTATELAENAADTKWTDVMTSDKRPDSKNETIVLEKPVKARYVRLLINEFTKDGPDPGDVSWDTISIYEMEVYGGLLKEEEGFDAIKNAIKVTAPGADDTELKYELPASEKFEVAYNGTDYEQVIDTNGKIYRPVVDTTVKVSFKITEKATGEYQFKEVDIKVPGQYQREENDNAAPAVLPELREWKGHTGNFAPADTSRIVIADESLQAMADAFKADYKDLTGKDLAIVKAAEAKDGDFLFALTEDTSKGLKDEGYLMTVDTKVSVEAEDPTGAYWATRTILQSLKLTDNIPCGIARDYPLYKVRGFILDVGRKTFTMDYLRQFVKEMSWYKMNDFQIHLNDNLIPLEDYTKFNKDPMTAYSAFRLESDIKKGGNEGKNQADLTSTDVFYTKAEFKEFIKESRAIGVNIVPEIDTPAHSLALTKVRPDLRQGTSGRQNDHLALAAKYNECLDFVQSIFNEYMTGNDPVFDAETVVHIGADEYSADGNAYRRFCNDMMKFVNDSGRKARVWGSLTSIKGNVEVRGDQNPDNRVEMNLWNFGWANIDEMYELGFDLINCNDGHYYIVPAAGYYYDYLNEGIMYDQPINSIGGITIPAGDKQMIGGAFAVWNDMTDYLENGISEYDVYDRSVQHMALFAAKLWGKGSMNRAAAKAQSKKLGDAPNTDFGYDAPAKDGVIKHDTLDQTEKAVNAAAEAVDGKTALKLNGGESYVSTGLTTVGLGNDLRVKVKRTSDSTEEQILFESPYGSIKAVQKGTGKVGFSRENHDYSFDYVLPVDEWVELEIKNVKDVATLYVNGKLVDVLGDNDKTSNEMADLTGNYKNLHATTMFPVERIGSKTNAFVGYVDDLRIGTDAAFHSTMALDYAVVTANILSEKNAALKPLLADAAKIFAKFAPTEKEINDLTAKINAEIKKTEYQKADYRRVDSYLSLIPENMSVFTEKSVARLQAVVDSIRRDLPKEMQSTVDGYEAMLAEALNGLEVKKESNVNYVPSSEIEATASSSQDNSSAPGKALDNDLGTIWHSQWNKGGDGFNPNEPHWFDMKVGRKTGVNGLTYIPRSGAGNGTITKYEIVSFNDGDTKQTVIASGTWAKDTKEKVVNFKDTVYADHIRVKIVESVHNDGSAAEFKLHKADVKADIAGLNQVIEAAKAIANKGYTEESWNALQNKVKAAEALAGNAAADANEVEIMKRELTKAMTALVLKDEIIPEPEVTLKSIRVTAPTKTTYEIGEALDTAGMKVTAVYSDGTEKEIKEGYKLSGADLSTAGTKTVTVTYEGKTASFEITVNEKTEEDFFPDVTEKDYFYNSVMWGSENGIVQGYGNTGKFMPHMDCTRANIVTLLYREAGEPTPEGKDKYDFTDVPEDAYYADALQWAYENGIVQGYGNTGKFMPDAPCTRANIVTFLHRAEKEPTPEGKDKYDFTDVPEDVYYADALQWAYENGIVQGYGNTGKFMPDNTCTRAQSVTYLYRINVK